MSKLIPPYVPTKWCIPQVIDLGLNAYQKDRLIEVFEEYSTEVCSPGLTGNGIGAQPNSEEELEKVKQIRSVSRVVLNEFIAMLYQKGAPVEDINEIATLQQNLAQTMIDISMQEFGFVVDSADQIEFAKYEPGNHYQWHQDSSYMQSSRERKLSASLSLSDKEDYDGGELAFVVSAGDENPEEFYNSIPEFAGNFTMEKLDGGLYKLKMKFDSGKLVVFPSFMHHKVYPVESGIRYQVFGWVTGPRFE